MWPHNDIVTGSLAAALPQVADQLFARFKLCTGRLVAIEIAYQTDSERDVVQVIAVDMAAIDLAAPAITDFDLAVTGRCPIPNNKVIGETVLHATNMLVVIIEDTRIALSCTAIMHDNELPPTPFHRRAPDRIDQRTC